MRMFLVGMCDIFLLLYLTALAEVEARPVSALTVQDYKQLEKSKEQLEKQEKSREASLEAKEREALDLQKKVAALMQDMQRIQSEKSKLDHQVAATRKLSDEQIKKVQTEAAERAARLERLQEEARKSFEEREAKLAAQVEERAQKLAVEEQKSLELTSRLQLQQTLAEEARRKAEEASAERERALAEAESARQAREQALTYASQAISQAQTGKNLADLAFRRAQQADVERSEARSRVQKITQSAATAFARNVERKIVRIEVTATRRGLLRDSRSQAELSLLPVSFGNERVVFAPIAHLGLSGIEEKDVLKSVDVRVADSSATRAYRSKSVPDMIAIVVPSDVAASTPVGETGIRSFMPTLMAVRTGAEREISDRIRELAVTHFLFPRDRLTQDGDRRVRYTAEGFRGTGDFGEQILKGDQIVDLEGNFVGIAHTANDILVIPDLQGWSEFDMSSGRASAGD
jgi:hypothetical protein